MVDAFFLAEFKIWPEGCDPYNLFEEQREFFMYLTAVAPTRESLATWLSYKTAEQEILDTPVEEFLKKARKSNSAQDEVDKVLAQHRGRSAAIERNEQGEALRRQAIKKLQDRYTSYFSFNDDAEDEKTPKKGSVEYYSQIASQMQERQMREYKKVQDQLAGFNLLNERPPGLSNKNLDNEVDYLQDTEK